jgi:phage shock protein PspC (stress-responsive transcriptional regulator)
MNITEILLLSIAVLLVLILLVVIGAFYAKTFNLEGVGAGLRSIRKSTVDSKLAGVCAGLGEHSPIPAWIWRVIFLLSLFAGGVGLVVYLVLALCMPSAPNQHG